MKNKSPDIKKLLYVVVLVLLVLFVWYVFSPNEDQSVTIHYDVRPKALPGILTSLPDSIKESYGMSSAGEGSLRYSYDCIIDEKYPCNTAKSLLFKRLRSDGWQKLQYKLLHPVLEVALNDPDSGR